MNATTTIPASLADIYTKAADHIERVGWHQGDLYDHVQAKGTPREECRVCTIGALNVALYGKPSYPMEALGTPGAQDVESFFARRLGLAAAGLSIADWNDDDDRTVAQVTTALRKVAEAARKEAAA